MTEYSLTPPIPITLRVLLHLYKKWNRITFISWEPGIARHVSSNPVIHFTCADPVYVDTLDDLLSTGPPVRWPVLVFYPGEHWLTALLHARFVLGWHICLWQKGWGLQMTWRGKLLLFCVSLGNIMVPKSKKKISLYYLTRQKMWIFFFLKKNTKLQSIRQKTSN